ncbi:MAG: amidohydrolase family protein, partial [Caulobacteraceae bacterium]
MSERMDLVIKNGTIVTASESYKADVAVKNGKIAVISKDVELESDFVVDATGKLVLPGAIDAHVHLETPSAGTVSADSYEAGTRAAACGGTTMVFDFAVQGKGMGLVEAVRDRFKYVEPQACVDYAFHVAITDLTEEILDEFKASVEFGVPSFKLYMVYKDMMVDDGVIAATLERSKETGALIAVHAENPYLIDSRIKKFL